MAKRKKKVAIDIETPDGEPKDVIVVSENNLGRMVSSRILDVAAIAVPTVIATQTLKFLIRHGHEFTIANKNNCEVWLSTNTYVMKVLQYFIEKDKVAERYADMGAGEFLEKLFGDL